jgi:nucleotide-binding universal stress UspA family protein
LIFHPTDLSKTSEVAFDHALALALRTKHPLVVMHASDKAERAPDWQEVPRIQEKLVDWGIIPDGEGLSDFMEETGFQAKKVEASGYDPVEIMADYIDEHDVSMIVMATEARAGTPSWVKPSLSGRLAEIVDQPMLFIRKGTDGILDKNGQFDLRRVLIAVDHEPDPQLAIDWLAKSADSFTDRTLYACALHVGPEPLDPAPILPEDPAIKFSVETVNGEPSEQIAAIVDAWKANLVLTTQAGPQGLKESWIGSTTEQIIRAARCAVLSLKAPSLSV